jgi:hypothetical protein
MVMQFTKATKKSARGRVGMLGPSGSGKTFSALRVATAMADLIEKLTGKRPTIRVIDSERGSAAKYSGNEVDIVKGTFIFDHLELTDFAPQLYIEAMERAAAVGQEGDILIVDSLSHAWMGKGGALEQKEAAGKRNKGNDWAAWREITPLHNALVDAMLQHPHHVIGTMRVKTEWVIEKDKDGKSVPRKIGMQPQQRDGMEYEFDVVGEIDLDHYWSISKTRCPSLDMKVLQKPGENFAVPFVAWLSDGVAPAPAPAPTPAAPAAPAAPAKEEHPASPPAQTAAPTGTAAAEGTAPSTGASPTPATTPAPAASTTTETPSTAPSAALASSSAPPSAPATTKDSEFERLTRLLASFTNSKEMARFPKLVKEATDKKQVNRKEYDELVGSYKTYKAAMEKHEQQQKGAA